MIQTKRPPHHQARHEGSQPLDLTPAECGFTLIELVIVIVILAVLAAVAFPIFIDMSKTARVATVKATAGAISAAAELAADTCRLTPGCAFDSYTSPLVNGPDGTAHIFFYGYPTGKSRVNDYFGIRDWVAVQGFTGSESADAKSTEFTLDGAPDPSLCKVVFHEAVPPNPPTIVSTTTGC